MSAEASMQRVRTTGTGANYEAQVTSIKALEKGVCFIMIPHDSSTTTTPTLNVNGLGAISIERKFGAEYTSETEGGTTTGWISKGIPIFVMYDGYRWVVQGMPIITFEDIANGQVLPIRMGGTGAITKEKARENIGAAPSVHEHSCANANLAGFMSATDKRKLDTLHIGRTWVKLSISKRFDTDQYYETRTLIFDYISPYEYESKPTPSEILRDLTELDMEQFFACVRLWKSTEAEGTTAKKTYHMMIQREDLRFYGYDNSIEFGIDVNPLVDEYSARMIGLADSTKGLFT